LQVTTAANTKATIIRDMTVCSSIESKYYVGGTSYRYVRFPCGRKQYVPPKSLVNIYRQTAILCVGVQSVSIYTVDEGRAFLLSAGIHL